MGELDTRDESRSVKPTLLYEDLTPGRKFAPLVFPLDRKLVDRYQRLIEGTEERYTGPNSLAPLGLATVWARKSYLEEYSMPPGGVLLGQTITSLAPTQVGEVLYVQAEVVSREERDGKRNASIRAVAVLSDGRPCVEVLIAARWPQ